MNAIPHFARSYADARAKFLPAARARDLALDSQELPDLRGVEGEVLAMDVAVLGERETESVLVLTSATHGIEGYCGSGAQVGLLHDEEFVRAVQAAGVAVLMVHAVNPHGFSYGRRVNEDNVDLNRNFHDFAAPLPVNGKSRIRLSASRQMAVRPRPASMSCTVWSALRASASKLANDTTVRTSSTA